MPATRPFPRAPLSASSCLGLVGLTLLLTGCPGYLDEVGWASDGGVAIEQPAADRAPEVPPTGSDAAVATPPLTGTGPVQPPAQQPPVQQPPVQQPPAQQPPVQQPPVQQPPAQQPPPAPPAAPDAGVLADAAAPPTAPPRVDAGGGAPDTAPPPTSAAPLPCAAPAEIAAKILTPKCGQCHGKTAPAAGLDLVTTGIKARLVGVAARGCAGRTLARPDGTGHFMDKLVGAVAGCGGQMPFGAGPLSDTEMTCLRAWLAPAP